MIPHSQPTFTGHEARALERVLKSGQVSYGGVVHLFERELAKFVGVSDAVAVQSGSAALHLALLGLDVGKGDAVILPTYCCAAVLNAVHYVGAVPILVDIDSQTYNLDAKEVGRKMSRAVHRRGGAPLKAIIAPHMFGLAAPMKELQAFGVPLIEDCAMALGGTYRGEKLGSLGDIAVCSFYATKVMTTGVGGALLTRDQKIARRLRDLIRYDNREDYHVRYNYGMSALSAAIGREQLRQLNGFLQRRRHMAEFYFSQLAELPLGGAPLGLPRRTPEHIYYRFVIDVGRHRHSFIEWMRRRGVECKRPVYRPLHHYFPCLPCRTPVCLTGRRHRQGGREKFPVADAVHERCVSIPLYPSLTEREARHIAQAIREFRKF